MSSWTIISTQPWTNLSTQPCRFVSPEHNHQPNSANLSTRSWYEKNVLTTSTYSWRHPCSGPGTPPFYGKRARSPRMTSRPVEFLWVQQTGWLQMVRDTWVFWEKRNIFIQIIGYPRLHKTSSLYHVKLIWANSFRSAWAHDGFCVIGADFTLNFCPSPKT